MSERGIPKPTKVKVKKVSKTIVKKIVAENSWAKKTDATFFIAEIEEKTAVYVCFQEKIDYYIVVTVFWAESKKSFQKKHRK